MAWQVAALCGFCQNLVLRVDSRPIHAACVDELQMETYLESTDIAVRLYMQYEFVVVPDAANLRFEHPAGVEGNAVWRRIVDGLRHDPVSISWRPIQGRHRGMLP